MLKFQAKIKGVICHLCYYLRNCGAVSVGKQNLKFWSGNLKSDYSWADDSMMLFSVLVSGDLKLLCNSFYKLSNQHLFLLMRCR